MHRPLRPAQRACAVALFLAHLLVMAAAGLPAFHEWLHDHAGQCHHECAASAYANGQIDQPFVPLVPTGPALPREMGILPAESLPILFAAASGSRERAPPGA